MGAHSSLDDSAARLRAAIQRLERAAARTGAGMTQGDIAARHARLKAAAAATLADLDALIARYDKG